eukprot:g3207.t1
MGSHDAAKSFSAVARLVQANVKDAEDRCSAFQLQCGTGEFLASTRGEDRAAAARWWWREYTSLTDGIKSLIDGKIRHEYDRNKAVRTPNHEGIDWQKASLRTGESLDNLRRLLKKARSKHEVGEFDLLNLRIEDLQESIKNIREFFVNKVRGAVVNKFGEETQELCLKPRGKWEELRLLPPCGYGLEECTCGAASSPPRPVHDESLREAIEEAARESSAAAAAAAAAAAVVAGEVAGAGKRVNNSNYHDHHGGHFAGSSATAERGAKRHRASDGPSNDGSGDDSARAGQQRGRRALQQLQASLPATASEVPPDETNRQMLKSPLELERRGDALEGETRTTSGRNSIFDRGGGMARRAESAQEGRDRRREQDGHSGGGGDDGGSTGSGDGDGEQHHQQQPTEEEDWRDDLLGMLPHERAEAYEERGLFRGALRWHREDLAAARARALDGDEEDEREASLDLARALRNTGRCLGRLGTGGFTESKNYLTEACELVGPDGPSPSPAEEQDVVLELGNLWYNRYLACDAQGVRFLADEALAAALRYYRESRELCVDLVADGSEEGVIGRRGSSAPKEEEVSADTAARGGLLRAEYNVGMTLLEQDKPADAARHLAAAVSIFRDVFARSRGGGSSRGQQAGGSGGEGNEEGGGVAAARRSGRELEASTMAAWKAAGLEQEELAGLGGVYASSLFLLVEQEELAGLGGVYASSLFLLAECLAASPGGFARSPPAGVGAPAAKGNDLPRVLETLEASAGAFLSIEDPARALDPLLKLVETLQQSPSDAGDERRSLLSSAEALCEQASSGLGAPTEDALGEDGSDVEDERLQLDQVREEIRKLRALWETGDNSSGGGSERERQGPASPADQQRRGSAGVEGASAPSGPTDVTPVRLVGPAPTSEFAERRRRLRVAAAATIGGAGGAARNATSRKSKAPNRSRQTTTTTEALPGATAATHGGGVGAPRGERLARDGVGSFAGLRAAVAAGEVAAAAAAVAPTAGTEGGAAGENQDGPKALLFHSYREKCRDLQEQPNPSVLARLAGADCERAVLAAAASSAAAAADDEDGNDHDLLSSSPNEPRHRSLDLGACRLTDRELRVLLHVLSDERVRDKPTMAAAAEAAEAAGSATSTGARAAAATGPPLRFSALLLGRNPGIGAGALGALRGLLSFLLRLDLSRCGLTAADLAGFSSANGDGGTASGADQGAAATVCLRALVLRDNPLTRVRKGGAATGQGMDMGQGTQHWTERGRRGVDALRDLIARAPALEILDVSGCSQLPDGPAGRLYSREVSEILASALSSGLEARVARKAASDAGGTGYSGGVGDGDGESDGRAQVSTLRIGNNRFWRSSWRCLLGHLASHPPRELDLSFGSVLPRCTAAAVARDAASSRTPVRDTGAATSAAAAAVASERNALPSAGGRPELSENPMPEQSLGELLAATVLPADAPGVEILNLTGSTGLLLEHQHQHQHQHQHREVDGGRDAAEDGGGAPPSGSSPPCPSTAAFMMLLRDALMSPLCTATHLLLPGVRGSSPSLPRGATATTTATVTADGSPSPSGFGGRALRCAFGPRDATSLCEAASACASLRCLDLAGCDLSGPEGASAAVAAVSCLARDYHDDDDDGGGYGPPVAGGLDRLSLRACGLGASGLSAVVRALVALTRDHGQGARREGRRPRLPRLLDLSDNRPLGAGDGAGAGAGGFVDGPSGDRGPGGSGADEGAGLEGADVAALSDLAASGRALQLGGLASVVVSCDSRRPPMRRRTSTSREPALIDLSGNRLTFDVEDA